MKILMIAPEPFFEPRGTPFSEYFRIKALTELGHQVDLATYPMGKNIEVSGLRIFRSAPRFVKKVEVGPSLLKIFLDVLLVFTVLRLLLRNRYDCIHTHEEACFMGAILGRLYRIPHVYDMHSSLSQQFINFNVTRSRWIQRILRFFEKWAIRSSDAIIAICPHLVEQVRREGVSKKVWLIENTPEAEGLYDPDIDGRRLSKDDFSGRAVILYAGTFEHYQGLDLLMESIPEVVREEPKALFLLIGGDSRTIERYRKLSEELTVDRNVMLKEKVPASEVCGYFRIADVLVSPRKTGTNTPLKIYSYLRSGKPIVATNLVTHTQVLNNDIAILTEPDARSFAQGILEALRSPRVQTMALRARQVADEKYSYKEYVAKTSHLYSYVGSLRDPQRYLKNNASETAY